ncbi:hypothetical protein ABL78_3140 [Leptomonas seymouri]|uniref:Uncharacterized protein n=1 Tax=Leptomonas seymouri TaxID=5684 RepID=A0A0N1IL70_LEPSE|nr:hypothetical protein ABL78_3140 [Leptomonas seymouri]|eukprot:KPI87782.1 hypothetical protein ABL78_3140 [Leptomonas seymouri]
MHFSRKRYRPLDSAEERAVHVNQRVQLFPLENEQSYCFSWPGVPLTQWLQENVAYATLYQLIASASGGSAGVGNTVTTSGNDAFSAACFADNYSTGGIVGSSGGRRDQLGNSPLNTVSSSVALAATAIASSRRRQVDLPPVLTLDEVGEPPLLSATFANGAFSAHSEAAPSARYGGDMHELLRSIQHDIDAVHKNASSTTSARGGDVPTHPASSASAPAREWGAEKLHIARALGETDALVATSASIVISADAPRAVPHPLAPPRPQGVTEDSIFTLSESQLIDLEAAGVPALCAEEDSFLREQEQKRQRESEENQGHTEAHSGNLKHDAHQDVREGLSSSSSSPAMVVVVEEEACANERGDDSSSSLLSHAGGAANQQRLQEQKLGQYFYVSETYRRAIEQEVVGLEWRTWTQSQRTAAALQRLLSLEAAVPFEPCGDAHRDAWRAVVYRLWLRWRQQALRDADDDVSKAPCSPVCSATSQRPPPPLSSPSPPPLQPYIQSHRLPWGAPLLAGAYLYGASDNYFISVPSAAASLSAGGSSRCGGVASMWPAMSRRRGVYSFLRWRVELYEAQMPQMADGTEEVDDDDAMDNTNCSSNGDGMADVNVREKQGCGAGGEGGADSPQLAKVNRYAKGPLGQTGTLPSGRLKRRGALDKTASGQAAASSSSSSASRRPSSWTAPAQVASGSPPHHSLNTVMSTAHIKALIQNTVLTQPLTELQMDDAPSAVMERLACPDLRHETDAWRLWLSKV